MLCFFYSNYISNYVKLKVTKFEVMLEKTETTLALFDKIWQKQKNPFRFFKEQSLSDFTKLITFYKDWKGKVLDQISKYIKINICMKIFQKPSYLPGVTLKSTPSYSLLIFWSKNYSFHKVSFWGCDINKIN